MNKCQICHSDLTNIKLAFRARMKSGPRSRKRYQAWCSSCSIFLTKTYDQWISSPILLEELDHEISELELTKILNQIEIEDKECSVFNRLEKWKTFISMKQDDDKLYRFSRQDGTRTRTGVVIKRDAHLIGFYYVDIE